MDTRPSVWAFAGSKGGVGRTLLTANLGIQLARSGRRVVLVDLDLQGSNLPTALGYQRLPRTLVDFATGRAGVLSDVVCETPTAHLRLIGGLQRATDLKDDPVAFVRRVSEQYPTLSADHILVDCGSGRSPAAVAAFAEAEIGVLVATPEPAAVEGAYLFTEAFLRWAQLRALTGEQMAAIEARLRTAGHDPARLTFRALMTRLGAMERDLRDRVATEVRRTRLELILNQVRGESEEETARCLASGFRKCFGLALHTAGIVEHDLSVLQAIQKRRSLSQQYPNAPATKAIARAAMRLLSAAARPQREGDEEWEDLETLDHYRVLEVVPKASPKEVQTAYQVLKRTYDPETTFLSPIVEATSLRDLQARIESAYRTLIFLESRSEYDKRMLSSGTLKEEDVRGLHAVPAPAAPAAAGPPEATGPAPVAIPTPPAAESAAAGPALPADAPPADAPPPADPGSTAPVLELAGGTAVSRTPGPGSEGALETPEAVAVAPAAPRPVATSGAELRDERLHQHLTLEGIAEQTKIRRAYLQAIEEERFGDLPAAVFVRGFLREYARSLGLPGDEVMRQYMKRYQDWQESRLQPPATGAAGGR
jgi:flagellar biosynthesis protein FlhG